MESREFISYVKRVFPYADVVPADPCSNSTAVFVNISDVGFSPASQFATRLARNLASEGYIVTEKTKKDGLPYGQTGEWDYVVFTLEDEYKSSVVYINGIGTSEHVSLIVTLVEI